MARGYQIGNRTARALGPAADADDQSMLRRLSDTDTKSAALSAALRRNETETVIAMDRLRAILAVCKARA